MSSGSAHSAKLFARVWTSHGHPQPYLTAQQAELSSNLSEVITALTPGQTDPPEVVARKLRFLAGTAGGSYPVQQQIWELAQLLREGDLDAVERGWLRPSCFEAFDMKPDMRQLSFPFQKKLLHNFAIY